MAERPDDSDRLLPGVEYDMVLTPRPLRNERSYLAVPRERYEQLMADNARLAAELAGALAVVEAARALRKLRSGSVIKVSAWDPAFDDLLAAVDAWEAGAS